MSCGTPSGADEGSGQIGSALVADLSDEVLLGFLDAPLVADQTLVQFERRILRVQATLLLRRRSVDPSVVEAALTRIVRSLMTNGEREVRSRAIGERVMEALRDLDQVAYVRFASVYRNFREAADFEDFIGREIAGRDDD